MSFEKVQFEKVLQEHTRMHILLFLSGQGDWLLNEATLRSGLSYRGLSMSKDKIRTELAWLAEQGLIKVETEAEIQVATLLSRGLDVANGVATLPGVTRPSPEDR